MEDRPSVTTLYKRLRELNKTLLPGETLKKRREWEPITKIEDWLWLGGCDMEEDDPFYFFFRHIGHRVDAVISIMDNHTYWYRCPTDTREHTFIRFCDDKNTHAKQHFTYLAECMEGYRKRGKTVFIHCVMGISRSVSTVIHYFNRFMRMNVNDAYSYVRNKRRVINPNNGFLRQLCEMAYHHEPLEEGEIDEVLEEGTVILSSF